AVALCLGRCLPYCLSFRSAAEESAVGPVPFYQIAIPIDKTPLALQSLHELNRKARRAGPPSLLRRRANLSCLDSHRPRPHGHRLRRQPLRSLPSPAKRHRLQPPHPHNRPLPMVRSSPRSPRRHRHPELRPPPPATDSRTKLRHLAARPHLPRSCHPRFNPRRLRTRIGNILLPRPRISSALSAEFLDSNAEILSE